jgi:hypothetical protein
VRDARARGLTTRQVLLDHLVDWLVSELQAPSTPTSSGPRSLAFALYPRNGANDER